MSRRNNVVKFTRRPDINIGLIIFAVIFIYLIISVLMYVFSKKTTIYEVNAGSLAFNNTYTGFIIRDETVFNSDYSGNINYFLGSSERASIGTVIYSVDETGRVSDKIEESIVDELSSEEISEIKDMLTELSMSYSMSDFSNLYGYSEEISNKIHEFRTNDIYELLDDFIAETESENLFHQIKSTAAGLVSYTIDGYENTSEAVLSEKIFDMSTYENTGLLNTQLINQGDPVYKLINSENWNIYIPLTSTEAAALDGVTSIEVDFVNDDLQCPVDFEVITVGSNSYGKISLDRYVINFLDDRYVQIKISVDNFNGLKIPVSAIFEKSFYTIPKEYLTPSGTFIRKYYNEKGEIMTAAISAEIYEEDDKYYYVSMDLFSSGDILMLPDSDETFIVGTMEELTGVYCVNRGYAIFKKVDILKQNSEYCVVKKGTSYGLSIYDHIVLDYTTINENEIVN